MRTSKEKQMSSGSTFFLCLFLFLFLGFLKSSSEETAFGNCGESKNAAILVVRVGNEQAFSPMTEISMETDYSIRTPKMGTDVFIDNEKRLAESIPTYPKYSGNTQGYIIEYYKNMTGEIYEGLKTAFEQKGYKVCDLKQLSKSWDKPFHEMTIENIVKALSGKADYLFIFHYMDIGNSSIDSKTYRVKASNSGFTSMVFSYTLFDIAEQEDVFSYSPMIGFAVTPSIIHNPEIMENPEMRKRIIVNCSNENNNESYKLSHDFTDSELIKLLLNNILNGFNCPDKKYVECYDKCRFYEIKSLIPQIP